MREEDKSKNRPTNELSELGRRPAEFEGRGTGEFCNEADPLYRSLGFGLAVGGARLGLWEWNVESGEVFFNQRSAEILGYTEHETRPLKFEWHELIHPEDKALVLSTVAEHVAGRTPFYETEHRRRHKSGEWRWILSRGLVIERDPHGAPLRVAGVHMDITDRKRAEEKLRQSESMLKTLLDTCPVGIAFVEEEKLRWLNVAWKKMFRLDGIDGHLGKSTRILYYSEEEYERVCTECSKTLVVQGVTEYDAELRRTDGSSFAANLRLKTLDATEASNGYVVVITDISERKRIETMLKDEKQKFHTVAEHAPMGMVMIGENGTFDYVNQKFLQMFGYDPKEIPDGRQWFKKAFPDPEFRRRVIAAWVDDLKRSPPGERRQKTLTVTCKDGTKKTVEFRPVELETGQHVMTCEDITDRIRAEETLRESEARLSLALSGANLGLWDWDLTNGKAVWNSRTTAMLGYGPNDVEPNLRNWKKLVHEEDWPKVSQVLNLHLAGKLPMFEAEYRIRNASGDWQWIQARGKVVEFSEDRKPVRMTGTTLDVTQRKAARNALDLERSRLRALWDLNRLADAPIREITDFALGSAVDLTRSQVGYLAFTDDGETQIATHVWPRHSAEPCKVVDKSMGCCVETAELCCEAVRRRKPVISNDVSVSNPLKRHMNVPIFDGDKIVAVAGVANKPDDYDQSDVRQVKLLMQGMWGLIVRKRAQEELRKSKEEMEALLNATPDVALLIDTEGNILASNGALSILVDTPREELKGKSVFELMPPELAETRRAWLRKVVESDKCVNWEDEHAERILDNTLVPIRGPRGTVEGAAVFTRDITESKRAQEGASQAQKLAAVAELASGVAHNFNNILQIVLGGSQLALSDLEAGSISGAQDSLNQIIESAKSGAETVKRLQEFARVRIAPETGRGEVFDLSRTVEDALAMTRAWRQTRLEKEGAGVSLKRDLRKGSLVRGTENELFEVVVNLIKNASEALSKGGEITVRVQVEDPHVKLTVRDNGTGIPPKYRTRIFEPFWTTKGSQGTGMGLSSSLGIIQRHGGKISVESRQGEGTVFTVLLPMVHGETTTNQSEAASAPNLGLKILVIDDMPAVTRQLESALTKFGQTVATAFNGRQAIRTFCEKSIDLIICDLGMPGINGWQVGESIKEICNEQGRPKPPFIMLTGWGGQLGQRDRIIKAGVDRIVEKPIDVEELMDVVRELTRSDLPKHG